jgi:flagellar protein FliL
MLKFGKKKKDAGLPATTDAPAEGGDAAEGEGAPGKKKPPMLLIIGAAAAVVLLGGGAAAFFLMQPGSAEASGDETHASPPPPPAKKGGGGHGAPSDAAGGAGTIAAGPDGVTFFTLPDMVVNIQSPDGRPTFLKLKLTLEMEDAHLAQTLQAEAPRLQDMFQGSLRELRPEELAGSAGSHQLRQELLRRVNLIAAPGHVDAVLIEEMLVQ